MRAYLCLSAWFLVFSCVVGCASGRLSPSSYQSDMSTKSLEDWILVQEVKSWNHLQENISPTESKVKGQAKPLPGIVVAALSKKDPDYYFHWVRDSAHVMEIVAEAYELNRPYVDSSKVDGQFHDFLKLSRRLQKLPSKWGLGEPRFTVTGEVDTLPWSRPQYDGPALRAIAVLAILNAMEVRQRTDPKTQRLALEVLMADLNFIEHIWPERGFDVWEEYKGDNFQTRMVQLAALEKGAAWLKTHKGRPADIERFSRLVGQLSKLLDDHWDPARGFFKAQLALVATDGYTAKKTDLDSAVVLSVVDGNRDTYAFSVMDDRVQSTVKILEDLFRNTYPINNQNTLGLAYGRYMGDIYYGGNPWFLITANYAKFYYEIVRHLRMGQSFQVTSRNMEFLRSSLSPAAVEALKPPVAVTPSMPLHQVMAAGFMHKADLIMQRFRYHTPADGQLFEQFDKSSGKPTGSKGIGWSHSAFLSAAYARFRVNSLPKAH